MFARSVYRNIIYGLEGTDLEPSLEEIKVAARLANAHDFIEVNAFKSFFNVKDKLADYKSLFFSHSLEATTPM